MPTFFEGPAGRTIAFTDMHAQGSTSLARISPEISWDGQRSIITRVTVSQQGNYQFLHTIGNDVYIYVFGDRVGSVTISGLSLVRCNADGHGFEDIMAWYQNYRVAAMKSPLEVTIGDGLVIEGFLTGITGDVVDPGTRIMQFGLQLATIPEK